MTTYVKISDVPRYPQEYVSPRLAKVIQQDGLIEPILAKRQNGKITSIHPYDRERSEAFIREVARLQAKDLQPTGSIILIFWDELDSAEKTEYVGGWK